MGNLMFRKSVMEINVENLWHKVFFNIIFISFGEKKYGFKSFVLES